MTHSELFLLETAELAARLDFWKIEQMADALSKCSGRVYVIGLGGSMANAIHFAADLRKLCNLDATVFDNIAELTARMNDEGAETIFDSWIAKISQKDVLFVLSVGGGTEKVSRGISRGLERARGNGATIFGIVGPDGGKTALNASICIKVPVENKERITPHTEAFQAVIWHCLVSHPYLQKNKTKW